MKNPLRRRGSDKPPPEPMSDAEFEQMIEAHVLRGWTVLSRTENTATLVYRQVDRAAILAHGSRSLRHGTPMKEERLVLTRWERRDIWLTKDERRQLGGR